MTNIPVGTKNSWTQGSLSTGWTFFAGKALTITAYATSDAGAKTQVTCAAHGLVNGDIVTIANTTNYDGIYIIEQKTDNTFVIAKAYVSDNGASVGHAAGYLTNTDAGSTGTYWIAGKASSTPETNNETFDFSFFHGVTQYENTESRIKLGIAADFSIAGAIGFCAYTAGEKIWAGCWNESGVGNITVRNGNMTIRQVS